MNYIFLRALLFAVFISTTHANLYPPESLYQQVRVLHKGPMLTALISNAAGSSNVLGYKRWGYLSRFNPNSLAAVITYTCISKKAQVQRVSVMGLGREWHGTGYLSVPFSFTDFMPDGCPFPSKQDVKIAFTEATDHWDNGGQGLDYQYSEVEINWSPIAFNTQAPADYGTLNLAAWDFIVRQMRE